MQTLILQTRTQQYVHTHLAKVTVSSRIFCSPLLPRIQRNVVFQFLHTRSIRHLRPRTPVLRGRALQYHFILSFHGCKKPILRVEFNGNRIVLEEILHGSGYSRVSAVAHEMDMVRNLGPTSYSKIHKSEWLLIRGGLHLNSFRAVEMTTDLRKEHQWISLATPWVDSAVDLSVSRITYCGHRLGTSHLLTSASPTEGLRVHESKHFLPRYSWTHSLGIKYCAARARNDPGASFNISWRTWILHFCFLSDIAVIGV